MRVNVTGVNLRVLTSCAQDMAELLFGESQRVPVDTIMWGNVYAVAVTTSRMVTTGPRMMRSLPLVWILLLSY